MAIVHATEESFAREVLEFFQAEDGIRDQH